MNKHGEVTMPKSGRTASNGVQTSNLPKRASKKKVAPCVKGSMAPPNPEAPAFMPREEVTN